MVVVGATAVLSRKSCPEGDNRTIEICRCRNNLIGLSIINILLASPMVFDPYIIVIFFFSLKHSWLSRSHNSQRWSFTKQQQQQNNNGTSRDLPKKTENWIRLIILHSYTCTCNDLCRENIKENCMRKFC